MPLFVIFFLIYGAFFLRELHWSRLRARGEETGLMWTIVGVTWVMGWIVSSFFWTVERRPLWWWNNLRYVVIASSVIIWLALRETEAREARTRVPSTDLRSFSRRFLALMSVFLAIAVVIVSFPSPYAHIEGVEILNQRLRPGDVVAVHGLPLEAVIPYIRVEGVTVVTWRNGFGGTYVLSGRDLTYPGFAKITALSGMNLLGEAFAVSLWKRVGLQSPSE